MRSACVKHAVHLAVNVEGPFSKIAREATEAGIIVPSILAAKLKESGYAINYQDGAKHGVWVLVTKDDAKKYDDENPNIVARAFSHDKPDALLQAVYAAIKEEAKA